MPPEGQIPPIVSEFFMALEFGWGLDYIRSLPWKDADMMTTLISTMYKVIGAGKDIRSKAFATSGGKLL